MTNRQTPIDQAALNERMNMEFASFDTQLLVNLRIASKLNEKLDDEIIDADTLFIKAIKSTSEVLEIPLEEATVMATTLIRTPGPIRTQLVMQDQLYRQAQKESGS